MDGFVKGLLGLILVIAVIYFLIIGFVWLVTQLLIIGLAALLVGLPMVTIMSSAFLAAWIYFRSKLLDPRSLLQSLPVHPNCDRMDFAPDGEALFDAVDFKSLRSSLGVIVVIYVGIHVCLLANNYVGPNHTQVMIGTFAAGLGAIPLIGASKTWMQASLRATTTNAMQRGEGCFARLRQMGDIATEIREMYLSVKITDISSFGEELAARLHANDDMQPDERLKHITDWALSERDLLQACLDEFAAVNTRFKIVAHKVNQVPVGTFLTEMEDIHCGLRSEEMLTKLRNGEWNEFSSILGGMFLNLEAIEQRIDEVESGGHTQQGQWQSVPNEIESLCTILGVDPSDDFETIKTQVKKSLTPLHPDKHEESDVMVKAVCENRFKELNSAFKQLKQLLGK